MSYLQPALTFLDWFKTWPGTTFHEHIEIVDLRSRGAGRGIVAKKDIAPETVLFTIPRQAILCSTTSELATLIPGLKTGDEKEEDKEDDKEDDDDENENGQDPWTSLILIMIYEYLRGEKSPWKAYFDVLPTVFDTPMFWADSELKELQASPVVGRVGRKEADEMITSKVLPVIRAHASVFFGSNVPLADDDLIQLAHRMGSTIMAYSFSLEKDDEDDEEQELPKEQGEDVDMMDGVEHGDSHDDHEHGPGCSHEHDHEDADGWVEDHDDQQPLGMVPMADMLNADAEPNAHINHGVEALTATSIRAIKAGEEILNYYGPLSNGELLRRYGYTTEKHAFFDAVDLPWELVQQKLIAELPGLAASDGDKISKMLADDEDDENDMEDPIMLDRDFEEDETTGQLSAPASGRVLAELPPALKKQARAFAKIASKRLQKKREKEKKEEPPVSKNKSGKYGKYGKAKVAPKEEVPRPDKEIAAAGILAAFKVRLAQYKTSLDKDEAQLQSMAASATSLSPSQSRLYAALRVRIGEKRLLTEAIALAKEALEEQKKPATSTKSKRNSRAMDIDEPSGKRQRM
ncbi:set domain-containing protein rms1 [Ophiostoma piceae UAMH 11346]|uniref:N-lysine methyltransferase SETD6 n=1 Tax=Ophiostoma piceae (strain UAMH 11346) TaxID=1262450 RepID=S3BR33_OPHP1|nr:set domain-containing protein rms1 [Ophiostoma piceae UAMH 11346]